MFRISTLLCLVLTLAAGTLLFNISQKTHDERQAIKKLERMIEAEKNSIAVLEAEWARLNAPHRLRQMARDYLVLDKDNIALIDLNILSEADIKLEEDIILSQPAPVTVLPKEILSRIEIIEVEPEVKLEFETVADIPFTGTPSLKPTFKRPQKVKPVFTADTPVVKPPVAQQARETTRDFGDVLKGLN